MMGFAMPAVAQKPYEGSLRVRDFDAPSDEIDLFVYANSPAAQKYFSCLQKHSVEHCSDLKPRGAYSFTALEGPRGEATFFWMSPQTYLVLAYAPSDESVIQVKLI